MKLAGLLSCACLGLLVNLLPYANALGQRSRRPTGPKTSATKYTLTLPQAPEIRGLRLGMELRQAQDIFPSLRSLTADEFGVINEENVPIAQTADRSKYTGIDFFGLKFLDDHLTSIYVAYDGSATWKSADEFAAKVSESLSLPSAWRRVIVTDKTMAKIPTYVHLMDHQRYME
jgi:hypothetical protein